MPAGIFLPMVHRCKKCSHISEVTSGGRGEIENVKNDIASDLSFEFCHQRSFVEGHCTFTTRDHCSKMCLLDFKMILY